MKVSLSPAGWPSVLASVAAIPYGYGCFAHTFAPKAGFGSFMHESRTDLSMLLGALFLLVVGAGGWSLDAALTRRRFDGRSS